LCSAALHNRGIHEAFLRDETVLHKVSPRGTLGWSDASIQATPSPPP